jgi:hypothetical protein
VALGEEQLRREEPAMPKVFGIHELVTKPDIDAAAFERFLTDEALPALRLPGTAVYILKGDRGERSGHYLLVFEFESVATRDRLFPAPDTTGPDTQQLLEAGRAVFEKWARFGTVPGSAWAPYTDYIEVSTQ